MNKNRKGIIVIVIIGILVPAIWHFTCNNKGETDEKDVVAKVANVDKAADTKIVKKVSADTLLGQWLRPDGNYILEISKISDDRTIEAKYFNPNPIHVARAELLMSEGLKIQVEFADKGYEGSTYDLIYDPGQDALIGTYYQATMGQTYQIGFVRIKN